VLFWDSGFGPGLSKLTSLAGSFTGRVRITTSSKIENIAVFAPMPNAMETIARIVTDGALNNVRNASLTLTIFTFSISAGNCCNVQPHINIAIFRPT
jgi:hypothetical protein